MLNKTILMGRLTKTPELKQTGNGVSVASFSLAVERDFKDKQSGEKQTDFIDCTAWRQTADFAAKYFTKGRMAIVEGRLQVREWLDKEGGKRRATEVLVENMYFGDSKTSGTTNSAPQTAAPTFAPAEPSVFTDLSDTESELPF